MELDPAEKVRRVRVHDGGAPGMFAVGRARSWPPARDLEDPRLRQGRHRGRSDQTLACIAEILSCFDLVAVREVSADLAELERVRRMLGSSWERIYTDGAAGNGERLGPRGRSSVAQRVASLLELLKT